MPRPKKATKPSPTPIEKEIRRIEKRRQNCVEQLRQAEAHVREVWQPKIDSWKKRIAEASELIEKLRS